MLKKHKIAHDDTVVNATPSISLAPTKVALIARDNTVEEGRRFAFTNHEIGFAPHFRAIVHACSREGCDMLLFALWSHGEKEAGILHRPALFPTGTDHAAVVIGVTGERTREEETQVWVRGASRPFVCRQQFARSTDSAKVKRAFVQHLSNRLFGPALLMLCGETNIIRTCRKSSCIADEFGVLGKLADWGVKVVLNPVHTYMRRYEMKRKRRALSEGERYCISVWNRGLGARGEAREPWTAFRDGQDITGEIRELPTPVEGVPGIRIGTLRIR